jgi:hypothetical protein
MQRLSKSNIGSILDLAIEADLDAEEKTGWAAKLAARNIVNQLKGAIDTAAHQPDSFIAVKVSSLIPPAVLHSLSSSLNKLKENAVEVNGNSDQLNFEQFKKLADHYTGLKSLDLSKLFAEYDLNKDGLLSYADLYAIFSIANFENCKALLSDHPVPAYDRKLTIEDIETFKLIFEEIDDLCEYAKTKNVKLMMDAEQSYFQPAIDSVVLAMCRKHNAKAGEKVQLKGPLVYNTYQMYLVDALDRLKSDVDRFELEQLSFGVKLVRGAYMVSERERAEKHGIKSPVHIDIESSHKSFDSGLEFIVQKQGSTVCSRDSCDLSMVVATHNHKSVQCTTELMERYAVPRTGGWISFGQLLGMQDGVTEQLACNGYKALKYVPYGPVPTILPYLHRRAQENSTMIKAMESDRAAIEKEIIYRVFGQ